MNYIQNKVREVFNDKFNGKKNFITPNVLSYSETHNYYIELSQGTGIDGQNIWGITVIEKDSKEHRHDLSNLFHSKQEADRFIKRLN